MGQRYWGRLATGSAVGTLLIGSTGMAEAQTNEELMDIIRQQQQQIEELSRKVEQLESGGVVTAVPAPVAPDVRVKVDYGSNNRPIPKLVLEEKTEATDEEGNPEYDTLFSFNPRGRLFVDGGYLNDDDDFYDDDNATELRAARLGVEGVAWRDLEYKLEADFADNEVDLKDALIEYGGDGLGGLGVTVGQFKTPNSLEEQTSSRYITFMERAALTDAFSLDRRIGIGTGFSGAAWGIDAGLFSQNAGDSAADEGYAVAGRGWYAFDLGDKSVLHVGGSGRFRNLSNDVDGKQVRYRQRPFFHFTGTRLSDTGALDDAENDVFAGGELALVLGRFSVQGEAAHTWLNRDDLDNASGLWGGYLGASYFVTGESRNYGGGKFDRVNVDKPVHEGGFGAVEIGGRFDYIDLNDNSNGVRGGQQYSIIAGVNWYLTNHTRFMLNYAYSRVDNAEDTGSATSGAAAAGDDNYVHGIGARFQVDF